MKTTTSESAIRLAISRLENASNAPLTMKQLHITAALMGLRAALPKPNRSAGKAFCARCGIAKLVHTAKDCSGYVDPGSFEARDLRRAQPALSLINDAEEDTMVDAEPFRP
jgi:hypothetical protein